MSDKNPFQLPDGNGAAGSTQESDDLRQLISSQRQEIDTSIAAVDAKIAKPGLRGGFNVDDLQSYGTIQKAVAAIPATQNKTLFITNAQTVVDNLTVPANISIIMLFGGSFTISVGKTLTILGPFMVLGGSGFLGLGSVSFTSSPPITVPSMTLYGELLQRFSISESFGIPAGWYTQMVNPIFETGVLVTIEAGGLLFSDA